MRRTQRTLALAVLLAGCYHGLDARSSSDDAPPADSAADSSGDGSDSGDDPSAPLTCDGQPLTVGSAPLRRLTSRQYRNVIDDLLELGDDAPLGDLDYVLDGKAGAFAANTLAVDTQVARSYLLLAEDLAGAYVEGVLPDALTCDWSDAECVEPFVRELGRLAFRRPPTDAQVDAWLELHAGIVGPDGDAVAMTAVVTAMLASPSFLYHEEPIDPDSVEEGAAHVDAFAMASRLSFLLWDSAPDDELLDAAAAGDLDSARGVEAQVDRMLADERFDRTLAAFYGQWSGIDALDDLGSSDPDFTAQLRESMRDETLAFASHVYREGDGKLRTLLSSDYSFVDVELAKVYGVDAPSEAFERVELDPRERSGILTHPGVLAVTASTPFPVIFRGKLVNERLLCNTLTLPEDVEPDPEVDRLETQPCMGCHLYMDPIGEGFARYDALGRYHDRDEAGAEISQRGEIYGEAAFEGPRGLAELLLDDPRTPLCVATQWATFAAGRMPSDDDECTLEELGESFAQSDGDLRGLVRELATSPWLRARSIGGAR